ncbi:unnamed protein product [Phaedon cochleariae]|uniref:Gag-like protein n=1 Tax=Phaedon cochleariae TaxID=80249 RepID=A0A9N9SFF9_PHACE|nr:unnamed protein product [Phaedon cochleariae]
MKKTPGVFWKCKNCEKFNDLFDEGRLRDIFQNKVSQFIDELKNLFYDIKTDSLKKADENLSTLDIDIRKKADENISNLKNTSKPSSKPNMKSSYSSVLSNSSHSAILVKPKVSQENNQTKSDIMHYLNTQDSNFSFSKVKHIKDGGLMISCETQEETTLFKEKAQEKLSATYEIKESRGLHPRVRIVGISDNSDHDTLLKLILKQNDEIIGSNSNCMIVKFGPTKSNVNVYQVTLQLDSSTYSAVPNNDYLLIGLDLCKVYDAIEISRCFRCNGLNHSKTSCKQILSCPNCGGGHDKNACDSNILKCINCVKLNESKKSNFPIDHGAWDHQKCQAYSNVLNKLKFDLGLNCQ